MNLIILQHSDADAEPDPLFNIPPDQSKSPAPRRYCLKLVDIDPLSDEDSPFDSLFSFTASPVESPSYATTTFHPRQPPRPTPLSVQNQNSFLSPLSPDACFARQLGTGDRVDRWIHGGAGGGLEPLMTPMVVDNRTHEFWDDGGQSDWREVIDQFLQHAEWDADSDLLFPPTPAPGTSFLR